MIFEGNSASEEGGALFMSDVTMTFTESVFKSNTADIGGAIAVTGGTHLTL